MSAPVRVPVPDALRTLMDAAQRADLTEDIVESGFLTFPSREAARLWCAKLDAAIAAEVQILARVREEYGV